MKAIIVLSIIISCYILLTYLLFVLIFRRFDGFILNKAHKKIYKNADKYKDKFYEANAWLKDKEKKNLTEEVYIKSYDNLKLNGLLIKHKKHKGIMIIFHGYRSNATKNLFLSYYKYYEEGYSIILVNQRASSKSEGKYITFGIKERKDVISWVNYVNNRFKGKDVILAGISMGASSVLMSCKELEEKNNVKLIIADCGYVSAYDEIKYFYKKFSHLSGKVLIPIINFWCKLIGKFNLKDGNTIEALIGCNIPIIFIHGSSDTIVPTDNSIINYDVYNGKKDILIVDNANHGLSYFCDSEDYLNEINNML